MLKVVVGVVRGNQKKKKRLVILVFLWYTLDEEALLFFGAGETEFHWLLCVLEVSCVRGISVGPAVDLWTRSFGLCAVIILCQRSLQWAGVSFVFYSKRDREKSERRVPFFCSLILGIHVSATTTNGALAVKKRSRITSFSEI